MSNLEAIEFVAYVTVILISLHPPCLSLLITSIHSRPYHFRLPDQTSTAAQEGAGSRDGSLCPNAGIGFWFSDSLLSDYCHSQLRGLSGVEDVRWDTGVSVCFPRTCVWCVAALAGGQRATSLPVPSAPSAIILTVSTAR